MRIMKMNINILFLVCALLTGVSSYAQKKKPAKKSKAARTVKKPVSKPTNRSSKTVSLNDTIPDKTVVITSAFKPSLRNAAKINFNAASPNMDTVRMPLQYTVPSQQLFFSYNPVPVKPLALDIDSTLAFANNAFVKVGYGNFQTPYLEGAMSIGDGKKSLIYLHALHTSSKGTQPFQEFSRTSATLKGVFNDRLNHEWTTVLRYQHNGQFLYGFQPSSLNFTKDSLRQNFQTIGAEVDMRRKTPNSFGFTYHPKIKYSYFGLDAGIGESNLKVDAPFQKRLGRFFDLNLGFTADLTYLNPGQARSRVENTLFYVSPSVHFKTPNLMLEVGMMPSWDNANFTMLPNIKGQAKLKGERLVLQAGIAGSFQKNSFQSLAQMNPFIQVPQALLNTRIVEQYIGIKGSAGQYLTYNARLSHQRMRNMPVFINTGIGNRFFATPFESSADAIRLHAEVGYTLHEKLAIHAAATYLNFINLSNSREAFGILPFELTSGLKWKLFKDLHLNADMFFWDGSFYRNVNNDAFKLKPALDASIGVEFAVMPKLNVWMKMNNILNNRYQRWHQYEVLGFNVLGGVVYSFR